MDGSDVLVACRRLHAAIDALDHTAAGLLGISRNDLRCLNLLEHGPLPPSRIAVALSLTSGSTTALIDRLEKKGLVHRANHPVDRRGILVSATPRVFESIGQLYRSCADAVRRAVSTYPLKEQTDAVRHLTDAAEAWEAARLVGLGQEPQRAT